MLNGSKWLSQETIPAIYHIAPSLEPLKGKRLMLYSTNQLEDVEEAVEHLEESKEIVSLDNINNWLIENGRRTISNERIDDILIDLGYC